MKGQSWERERESTHWLNTKRPVISGDWTHTLVTFFFCFTMSVFTCLSCACSAPGQLFPSPVTTLRKKVQRRQVQEPVCTTTLLWKGRARPHLYPPGRVLIDWITPVKHILTSIIFIIHIDASCLFCCNPPLLSGASSVLQSPDGNWIALHSSQLSRPSLLTKRKSLVFSVLEKESGVVSAYDEMGSDSEQDNEGGWGAALRQFRRKLSDETYYTDSQHDPEWTYTQHLPVTSPSSGQYTNTETVYSDSEASSVPSACPRKSPHNPLRKKELSDTHLHPHHQPLYHQHLHQNIHPYPHPSDALDVNFNPKVAVSVWPCVVYCLVVKSETNLLWWFWPCWFQATGDSSEAEERQSDPVKRSRRRRKSKRDSTEQSSRTSGQSHTQSVYPTVQVPY